MFLHMNNKESKSHRIGARTVKRIVFSLFFVLLLCSGCRMYMNTLSVPTGQVMKSPIGMQQSADMMKYPKKLNMFGIRVKLQNPQKRMKPEA